MGIFLLEQLEQGGLSTQNSVKSMIIEADDSAKAISMANIQDSGDSPWTDATSTTIAAGVASDFLGFVYRVRVEGTAGLDVSYTGIASDDVDDVGAALVLLLNATTINGSSYSSNTLDVSSIADGLGDKTLQVTATPPSSVDSLSDLVGTVVDGGIAAAALTVDLVIPTAIPAVLKKL